MNALAIAATDTAISTELADLTEAARDYADASLSKKTRELYGTAWRLFSEWCAKPGLVPMPASPNTVALYVTHRAKIGRSVSSIGVDLAAIKLAHEVANAGVPEGDHVEIPTDSKVVRTVMRGIRRTTGTAPTQRRAISMKELRQMVASLDLNTNRGVRDAVVLVIGFASAMRRSEIVALNIEDIEDTENGLRVNIRRSKTDQEAAGRVIGLPYGSNPQTCPVRVLRRWLKLAEITEGPVFTTVDRADRIIAGQRMSKKAVARAVKRAAAAVGIDEKKVAGHSLRSGFATSAARAGASERAIARQTGHRSMAVLRRYIQEGELFAADSAAGMVGL